MDNASVLMALFGRAYDCCYDAINATVAINANENEDIVLQLQQFQPTNSSNWLPTPSEGHSLALNFGQISANPPKIL